MSNLAFHNDLSLNLLSDMLYMMAPITPFEFNGLLYGLFDPLSFSSQLFKHQSVLDQFTWQCSYWWTSVTLSSSTIVIWFLLTAQASPFLLLTTWNGSVAVLLTPIKLPQMDKIEKNLVIQKGTCWGRPWVGGILQKPCISSSKIMLLNIFSHDWSNDIIWNLI